MTDYNCACSLDPASHDTLGNLRTRLLLRTGYASQLASPPPGIVSLYNDYLMEAQRLLRTRYKPFTNVRWFTWNMSAGVRFYDFAANQEAATIPTPVIASVTTAAGGTLGAGTYTYRVSAVNLYGETLASAEVGVVAAANATNTVNWTAPTLPTGVSAITGYRIYGRSAGTEQLLASVGLVTTWADDGSLTPSGALPALNTTMQCVMTLNPGQVEWVGISLGDNVWRELSGGIDPHRYRSIVNGIPDSYAIRNCIEVWPPPKDNSWSLRIRGRFGMLPFAADTDTTTLHSDAVFLLALATAKRDKGKASWQADMQSLAVFLGDMTAETHATNRYIPGEQPEAPAVLPKMV